MRDNRDNYEPIIATRRAREREDAQPLWRLVLALGGGVVVVLLLAWWFIGRSSSDDASTTALSKNSAPETHAEQPPAPQARDSEANADIVQEPTPPARAVEPAVSTEQPATSESIPEVVPDNAPQAPLPPAPVSVRLTSPDTQVQFELRGPRDSSPHLTSKAGDVVTVAPGTYRVIASGAQLETFEQEIKFDGERPLQFTVELCAERKYQSENLAGRVVEERACASTDQCESMFVVLSEHAEQLVKDRAFRKQQCAKWRPEAASEGKWTLDAKCGGATLATTCRIEIAEGACVFAEPRRTVRGAACPRVKLE